VNAFLENVTVTFFVWPLACVLEADPATAIVLGNGALESLNISTPPHTAHPFMTHYPKNQLESNWVPLLDALSASQGFYIILVTGNTWLEATMRSLVVKRPDLRTLEDNLASISSLAYALLVQRWRSRHLRGDPTLASTWSPRNATVAGEHPVLKMHLQVNGIPLLVGSLSVLVLCAISAICVIGHDVTDNTLLDGGVIDMVSLMHNSALPELLAGHEEDGIQKMDETVFAMRKARAGRVMVASVLPAFCCDHILMLH